MPPEVLQQRYAAIELAYSEQNWPEAEGLSQALLAELPQVSGDPLRQRLLLLLGHTRLYGMADTATARQHYGTVLAESEEPTLRDIAEQGLEQCLALEQPPAAAAAAPEAASDVTAAATPSSETQPEAAMPWLEQLGGDAGANGTPAVGGGDAVPWLTQPGPGEAAPAEATAVAEAAAAEAEPAVTGLEMDTPVQEAAIEAQLSLEKAASEPPAEALAVELAVEIVEEPEQIAVAQADPQRREELEIQEPLVIGAAASGSAISGGEGATAAALQQAQREESDALAQEFSRNLLRLRLN